MPGGHEHPGECPSTGCFLGAWGSCLEGCSGTGIANAKPLSNTMLGVFGEP